MRDTQIALRLLFVLAALGWSRITLAQNPAALQPMQLSAFGGVAGDYTGLRGGKNLDVTAGVDLALPPVIGRRIRPTLEVRGRYPIDKGTISSQRDVLGGLRVDFLLGRRFHPYGDFLVGRGQMNYGDHGYIFRNREYILTTTWVFSPGAGFDYDLSQNFAVKVDGQYQRWSSAPVDGGTIYAKVGTIGLVYVFNFNRHGIH